MNAKPPSALWTQLHNAQHPRGMELQRKLARGHILTDAQLNSLYAQPTASWWMERDAKAAASALRLVKQGHVLQDHELGALRSSSNRLPEIVPRGVSNRPAASSALVHQPSPSQVALGYKQRIDLENNVTLRHAPSTSLEEAANAPHALSAPSLLGETAVERRVARDDRIKELERQIRQERRARRALERSASEPALSGAPATSGGRAGGHAPAANAWFEERDPEGRPVYVHLDGRRSQRERPAFGEGDVFGPLSYLAVSPFKRKSM